MPDYALIFTGVRAGLREGEIGALQWGEVQFGEGKDDGDRYVVIQRNYDGRWSRKMLTPKSRKLRRVDLSREPRTILIPGANVAFLDKLDGLTSPRQSTTRPQQRARQEVEGFREILPYEWVGGRDEAL